jgi:drug/metabolite transporter (DMT)-like permease
VLLLWLQTKPAPAMRAAVLGVCAGLCFGLSATFSKPVINDLHVSIAHTAADWRTWALLGFGFTGFVIQQLSLATGQLAPAMAAVSVSNPAVSVLLGIALYHERLTRPGLHVGVAILALVAAFAGAVMITLANRETEIPGAAPDLAMTSADVAPA